MISDLIPFGEWLPDQAAFMNEGLNTALNVLPEGKDYKPFKQLVGNIPPLPTDCKGAYSFLTQSGNVEAFAGTATALYRLTGSVWTVVTRVSGVYAVPNDMYWKFINYGDRVLATNYTDDIQSYIIGTSSKFENLSGTGTPPKAKYLMVINNFVMALNVVHPDDNSRGSRFQWSGIDNPTYWADSTTDDDTDIQMQSDFQDILDDLGLGSGLARLGDYAVGVFERGLVRAQYVGSPLFFKFETIQAAKGSRVPGSIISNGQMMAYLAEDGFYGFDGVQSFPIGNGKIDKTFYADVNPSLMHKVQGVVDPKNSFFAWLYQSNNAANNKPDKMIIYSLLNKRWTIAEVNATMIFEGLTSGYTLEDIGALYASLELVPYSLDSRIWAGGSNLLSAFTHDNRLGVFEGDNAEAVIETTETRFNNDGMALVSGVLPVIDTLDCTVAVGHRKLLSNPPVYTGESSVNNETGEADFFIENRYHRTRLTVAEGADWNKAQGVYFRADQAGKL